MWETPQDVKQKWANIRPRLERESTTKSVLRICVVVVGGVPLTVQGMPVLSVTKTSLEPRKMETSTTTWWQPIRRIQSVCSGFTGMVEVLIGVNAQGLPIFWTTPQKLQIEMK